MVIIRTSAVEVSIQAVSPVSSLGFSSAARTRAGRSSIPAAPTPASSGLSLSFMVFPSLCLLVDGRARSQRLDAGLSRPDADRLLDGHDEDLAVADLAAACRLAD